jgi:ribosomal protein S13
MLLNDKKNKYELIVGFVTLAISLSAFKDELKEVTLVFGSLGFTLAQYLLWIVYGFSICLYLYVIESIVRDTKIGNWRLFEYSVYFAYWLFVVLLLTPLLLTIAMIVYKVWSMISHIENQDLDWIKRTFIIITASILGVISQRITTKKFQFDREKHMEESEEKEIIALNNAIKLLDDGYYPQSILEGFKALQIHLSRLLTYRNIRHTSSMRDINDLALIHGILDDEELNQVNLLMKMRNLSAHTITTYSKEDAKSALSIIKNIVVKDN